MRSLIADDSRPMRAVAVHMLGKFGQCHEACDGREAVAVYAAALDRGEPFQLVVLDILMPRLNGVDA
ncbi:MAG: response regulator, partial [Desulfovibrio sp.]|nr:response regulator [Desulfovibrio sp.]